MKQSEFKKANETIAGEVTKGYKAIETGVVGGYKKIEEGVVSGYKKMEESVVDGFGKISDKGWRDGGGGESPAGEGAGRERGEAEALTEAGRRAAPPGWRSSFGRTDIIVVYDSDTETGFLKSPVSVFFVHRWGFIRYNGGM